MNCVKPLYLSAVLFCAALGAAYPANANSLIGQACSLGQVGTTEIDLDRTGVVGCFLTSPGSATAVWKGETITSSGTPQTFVAIGTTNISIQSPTWVTMDGMVLQIQAHQPNTQFVVHLYADIGKGGGLQFQFLMDGNVFANSSPIDLSPGVVTDGTSIEGAPLNYEAVVTVPDTNAHTITAQWSNTTNWADPSPSVQNGVMDPRILVATAIVN